jgi:hypothetical protein
MQNRVFGPYLACGIGSPVPIFNVQAPSGSPENPIVVYNPPVQPQPVSVVGQGTPENPIVVSPGNVRIGFRSLFGMQSRTLVPTLNVQAPPGRLLNPVGVSPRRCFQSGRKAVVEDAAAPLPPADPKGPGEIRIASLVPIWHAE